MLSGKQKIYNVSFKKPILASKIPQKHLLLFRKKQWQDVSSDVFQQKEFIQMFSNFKQIKITKLTVRNLPFLKVFQQPFNLSLPKLQSLMITNCNINSLQLFQNMSMPQLTALQFINSNIVNVSSLKKCNFLKIKTISFNKMGKSQCFPYQIIGLSDLVQFQEGPSIIFDERNIFPSDSLWFLKGKNIKKPLIYHYLIKIHLKDKWKINLKKNKNLFEMFELDDQIRNIFQSLK